MSNWTEFIISFWEVQLEENYEVPAPTMRRLIEDLKAHRGQHDAWPAKLRLSFTDIRELRRETSSLVGAYAYQPISCEVPTKVFGVDVDLIDDRRATKPPAGVLEFS